MKKIYFAVVLVLTSLVGVAHADSSVYGQLWAGSTEKSLQFSQAVLGVKAGLGGTAAADVSYNALANGLYSASVSYGGLVQSGDSLSVGLQASAVDKWLDATLGQSALNCFGCAPSKSAIYEFGVLGGKVALTGNEANNYSVAASAGVIPGTLNAIASGTYDNPSGKWLARGGLQLTAGAFSVVADGSKPDGADCEYGVAGKAALFSGVGVFGKIRKGGALLVGPTYDATKQLAVALGVGRDAAGADYHTDLRISANF